MSATAFPALRQAIIDALLASPAVADGRVDGPRTSPVPREWLSHVEVRVVAASVLSPFAGGSAAPRTVQSQVGITMLARALAGDQPDADLDAMLATVDERVRAIDPASVGASEIASEVQLQWEPEPGDTPQQTCTYSFAVQHDVGAALAAR